MGAIAVGFAAGWILRRRRRAALEMLKSGTSDQDLIDAEEGADVCSGQEASFAAAARSVWVQQQLSPWCSLSDWWVVGFAVVCMEF